MSKLRTLRDTQKALKKTFEQQKAQEWTEITAEIEARITHEINRLYRNGLKMSQIMREYGTSDYRTVRSRVLDHVVVPVADASGLVWHNVKDTLWEVTDGTHKARVVILEDEGEAVMMDHFGNPEFGAQVNEGAGYALWLARGN